MKLPFVGDRFLSQMIKWTMLVVFFLTIVGGCRAIVKIPDNMTIPAVFAFGDSIVDNGNNNNQITVVKCNFNPYGEDFSDGIPTGRCSNGKTPGDLICEQLGIKQLLPAYFDPYLNNEDFQTGVTFASGGSGYDPQTSELTFVISLMNQLELFKEYKRRLINLVGEERTNFILANSLFLLVAGSNDLTNTYFTIGLRRLQYDIHSYIDLMLQHASTLIKELFKLGARRIAVFNMPPIGCMPSIMVRECVETYNQVATIYNNKLSTTLESLNDNLGQESRIISIDIYTTLLDMIQNHRKYGFETVNRGCCGTGVIEVVILCNEFSTMCSNRSSYLFWDSYHPTEQGYRILVNQLIEKYINSFI